MDTSDLEKYVIFIRDFAGAMLVDLNDEEMLQDLKFTTQLQLEETQKIDCDQVNASMPSIPLSSDIFISFLPRALADVARATTMHIADSLWC